MTGNHFQQSQAASHNTLGHIWTFLGGPGGPYAPTRNLDFAIFKLFSDRFFSHHAVVPWNDREPLPATQGTLTQHSGSLLSIFGVAGGPICAYGKTRFRDFQAILRPFVLLSPCSALEWPGTTFSNPRHPHTTLWVTFEFIRGGRGAVCA